jgi:hypothetical protein
LTGKDPSGRETAGPSTSLRSKDISKKGPRNCRSLGFAGDDKGESGCWTENVFIPWVGRRPMDYSGRDDTSVAPSKSIPLAFWIFSLQKMCHPDRSVAKWRDLLFLFRFSHSAPFQGHKSYRTATLPFVIPTEAKRSGGICSAPLPGHKISRTEQAWREDFRLRRSGRCSIA